MAANNSEQSTPGPLAWTNRRIILLALAVGILLYLVFKLPTALGYVVVRVRDILLMLVLSVALAYFLKPIIDILMEVPSPLGPRARRALATLFAMLIVVGLIVLLITVIIQPLSAEITNLIDLNREWAEEVPARVQQLLDRYSELVSPEAADTINARLAEWAGAVFDFHANLFKNVVLSGRYLIGLVLIPVLAFYFVTDAQSLREGSASLLPERGRDSYQAMLSDVDEVIDSYIRVQLLIALGTTIATAMTLYLAGVRVFLTFGIMAGVFNLVPIIGPIVAGVPICGIALLQQGWITMLIVLGVFLAIQAVGSQVVAPKLLSGGAKLHPVVIIVSLLIGAEFFGVIGIFVAVPVVAALRVALLHYRGYVAGEEA
jgi:predicted PurR-regulated permease PerM